MVDAPYFFVNSWWEQWDTTIWHSSSTSSDRIGFVRSCSGIGTIHRTLSIKEVPGDLTVTSLPSLVSFWTFQWLNGAANFFWHVSGGIYSLQKRKSHTRLWNYAAARTFADTQHNLYWKVHMYILEHFGYTSCSLCSSCSSNLAMVARSSFRARSCRLSSLAF